jgi:methyl-accepting chemotaxis protein
VEVAGLQFGLIAGGAAVSTVLTRRNDRKASAALENINGALGTAEKSWEEICSSAQLMADERASLQVQVGALKSAARRYVVVSAAGGIEEVSAGFAAMVDESLGQVHGGTDHCAVAEDLARQARVQNALQTDGKAVECVHGGRVFELVAGRSSEDRTVLVVGDVTARYETAALRNSDRKEEVVVSIRPDGTVEQAHGGLAALGLSGTDFVGRKIETVLRSSNGDPLDWASVCKGRVAAHMFAGKDETGSSAWVRCQFYPVRSASGEVLQILGLLNDTTAVQKEQIRTKKLLATLMEGKAFIQFTPEGEVIDANKAFCDAMGYDQASDIKGKHHSLFVYEEERTSPSYAAHWSQLANGEPVNGTFRRRKKNGDEIFVMGWYAPVLDEHGRTEKVVKLAVDVTEHEKARITALERERRLGAERKRFIEELRRSMEGLAAGDLTMSLKPPFPEGFADVCETINEALDRLSATFDEVTSTSSAASGRSQEILAAVRDLSGRTESQAATLEESAAALEELTASVKTTAARTLEMSGEISDAYGAAQKGGEVVENAVGAMQEISGSSHEISQIIGLIDDIAFQTNLLALNAGVEAARAGDAGRGFAVVASEVRALAQRSSEAAKQIKDLISRSSDQVVRGVDLVDQTGSVLRDIITSVEAIKDAVQEVSATTSEQAQGLSEINTAVTQLDQVTQQNAAMNEEVTAAGDELAAATSRLDSIVGTFKTVASSSVKTPSAPPPVRQQQERVQLAYASSGNTALKEAPASDDDWTDF